MRRLIQRVQTPDNADAWARIAAHAPTFERSSYAAYLDARIDALLDGSQMLSWGYADGVRRVLEAILEDVLQDPRRRGDAPAQASVFNEWWDCVVGLIKLEAQREQQLQRALQREGSIQIQLATGSTAVSMDRADMGLELASWLQRLANIRRQPVLRRAQLLAELLAACGVGAERPSDEADLVAIYQAAARRTGLQMRASAARAALNDESVGGLLRMLAPQHCCTLSKVSAAPQDGCVALADYLGCWSALDRISAGELRIEAPTMRAIGAPDGACLLHVAFHAHGLPFEFDYHDEAGGFDEHFVEHLNRVAQSLCLPGSFLVDAVNSETDVQITYLPLRAAAALQLSGALNA